MFTRVSRRGFAICSLIACLAPFSQAQTISIRDGFATRVPGGKRSVLRTDPIEFQIVTGNWSSLVTEATSSAGSWKAVKADNDGVFSGQELAGGYVLAQVEVSEPKTMLLEASGASVAYVNGVPRAGDPYSFGYVSLPVSLKAGKNDLLFVVGRGRLAAKLIQPSSPVSLDSRDATLPDFVEGVQDKGQQWGAVVAKNATSQPQTVRLRSFLIAPNSKPSAITQVTIPAMSVRKVPVALHAAPGYHRVEIMGQDGAGSCDVRVERAKAGEAYRSTFVSNIDGSVQYYGVLPSKSKAKEQALFLALHGASVEAIGHARAYGQKDWGTLVAPTNRRPFGFDWEEVGRLDALEVLGIAMDRFAPNPSKVYLTGHSMGGHGTWSLGSLKPDLFSGLMPCAGWISFSTYAGGESYRADDPVHKMLFRANRIYETMDRVSNLSNKPVLAVHGDKDDVVPVTEARTMIAALSSNPKAKIFEEPGQGHWYDTDPAPGANCVDFEPGFQMFKANPKPKVIDSIRFVTPDPFLSDRYAWARIGEAEIPHVACTIDLTYEPHTVSVVGSTSNVYSLEIQRGPLKEVVLDGDRIPLKSKGPYAFQRVGGHWRATTPKDVFVVARGIKAIWNNRPILVLPTQTSVTDAASARDLATYWAETFWYRGNGDLEVVTDAEASKMKLDGRNVVLFGRKETNLLWQKLNPRSAIEVVPGRASFQSHTAVGEDIACLELARRPNNTQILLASWTGEAGARLLARSPVFLSGAAYPDVLVWRATSLVPGDATGFLAAGYNSAGWAGDEIAWRDAAK